MRDRQLVEDALIFSSEAATQIASVLPQIDLIVDLETVLLRQWHIILLMMTDQPIDTVVLIELIEKSKEIISDIQLINKSKK